MTALQPWWDAGSSPLTRGAHLNHLTGGHGTGLIPAYAGSTGFSMKTTIVLGAHPRLRGEHSAEAERIFFEEGSSPLTRGARTRCAVGTLQLGLIPAYAGSTLCA